MTKANKPLTKNAMAHSLRSAASALDHGRMATAKTKVAQVDAALCGLPDTSTPNGFDWRWVDCINVVMRDRGELAHLRDLDASLWDLFIGPLCDAVARGNVSSGMEQDNDLPDEIYGMPPVREDADA